MENFTNLDIETSGMTPHHEGEEKIKQSTGKSSFFTLLFSDKQYLLKMYRDFHPEDTEITEEEIEIQYILHVPHNGGFNELGFMSKDRILHLMEAQSIWWPNMPLEMMIQHGRILERYANHNNLDLLGVDPVEFPQAEFFALDSGNIPPDINALHLEDLMEDQNNPHARLRAKVIRQSGKSTVLDQYLAFTEVLKEQEAISGKRTMQTLQNAIQICIERGILVDFFKQNQEELRDLYVESF